MRIKLWPITTVLAILINDRRGTDTIDALSRLAGRGLLAGLSQYLPDGRSTLAEPPAADRGEALRML
jgi:hypothetical protein